MSGVDDVESGWLRQRVGPWSRRGKVWGRPEPLLVSMLPFPISTLRTVNLSYSTVGADFRSCLLCQMPMQRLNRVCSSSSSPLTTHS
jgi:hypothetical protein